MGSGQGLYSKIMLLVGGVFLVTTIAILAFIYISGSQQIEQEGLDRAESLNRMAFEALYASMRQGGGRQGNRGVIERLQQLGAFTQVRVVKGEPVVQQFGAEPDEVPQDELERRALTGAAVQETRWVDGYRVVRYVTPLPVHAECQRCHQAEIGAINGVISTEISLQAYESDLRRWRDLLLVALGGGLLALGVLTFYALRYLVIRPLQAIQRGAAAIAQGELGYRLQVHSGDELEALAQEFNRMAGQLQASYTHLEQKVAERTRELRGLIQIAETVNSSLNLEETLPAVLEQVLILTEAEAADIRVVQDGVVNMRASCRWPDSLLAQEQQIQPGYCLCGAVALDGQPRLAGDLRQEYPEARPCLVAGFCSGLCVPVMAKGQVVGVIHVVSSQPHVFHTRHQALLMAAGQHVGLAIEKARLYEAERSQRQLSETLRQTSQALSASLDLERVLHTLLEQLGQVLVVDAGLILLCEGDSLRVAAVRGRPDLGMERLLGYRLPISTSKDFARVFQEKQVLTFCQPGRRPPFAEGFRPIEEVDWCLVVPLLRADEVIGLLALEQLDHCYDEEEEPQIAMAFANHAVMAIENARLYSQVRDLNRELEARVEQRTQELREARDALAQQADQLRRLLDRTLDIQEEERHRIAHDLHDGIAQLIMGALYEAQAAKVCLPERPEVARGKLENAQEILKQVKTEMRRIIYDLHPEMLSSSGLIPALEMFINKYQAFSGVQCHLETSGPVLRLALERERGIYRIVQEALNNVARHAATDQVYVTLQFTPHTLYLVIEDNGRGFDRQAVQGSAQEHLGLVSMYERAQSLGGQLDIDSKPGHGTRVILRVPLNGQAGEHVYDQDSPSRGR